MFPQRRVDLHNVDGPEVLTGVLDPDEHLVWWYERERQSETGNFIRRAAIVAAMPWTIAFLFFQESFRLGHKRPVWLRAEILCAAGFFFVLPVVFTWLIPHLGRSTVYALTNRRVLMALGPRRENLRAVALKELGRVEVVNVHELLLTLRAEEKYRGRKALWTFLDTGRDDKWASPRWRVRDPESVQELLEKARNAVWYPTNSLSDDPELIRAVAPPSGPA